MAEDQPQIGGKIRRLRRQRHLTQADLAQSVGISGSYLNLIEHNRRAVTVPLLMKFSGYFGIEPGDLVEGDEAQLVGDLMELFGDDLFADADLTNHDIRDLAFSNPAIGRAVLRLFDKYRKMSDSRGDPAYATPGEGGTDDDDQHHHIATDAISDFLQENQNHFPPLEEAANRVRRDVESGSETLDQGLKTYLINVFGTEWRPASLPGGVARQVSADGRALEVSELLPRESAVFSVAHHIGLNAAEREIETIIVDSSLPEGDAPALARNVLAAYFAAALVMPYEPFLRACTEYRYDVERIGRHFGASFEQVCHRMTTLQRPGQSGVPMHLVRTDIAGNISKRFSLSGIHIPRHSGACPRWNVYAAFLQPGRINVQISQMPDAQTYFCISKSFEKGGYRHNMPRRNFSIGIGCHVSHAKKLIYSEGIDLSNDSQIVPIGVSCRICPRMECAQRAHPPANHRFRIDDSMRAESFYGRMG
jgi:hypothetical protein